MNRTRHKPPWDRATLRAKGTQAWLCIAFDAKRAE